jgi:3-oxoacyl-[acyl-carrier-protein] synthase-1
MSTAPYPITGIAICNAIGSNCREVGQSLFEGRSGLGPSPIPLPFETVVGAVDVELPMLPPELEAWTTRTTQIASLLLSELEAELDRLRSRWRPERIAVLLGTSTGGADTTENAYRSFLSSGSFPADYDLFRQHTFGSILHVVRSLSGATGPAWMVSTACTSSAKPLGSARRLISAGIIDAAIVGGIDTLCSMTLHGFRSLDALSKIACRPFCAERDGLNIGEGGALLLLERDAEPIALLEGVGESSDAYHISAPHPEGLGARMAMEHAIEEAGCSAASIDHVNAHGTGTRLNDVSESAAIEAILGREVPVTSTKGYTGHLLGAAGATEAVMAVMSVMQGWIPASLRAGPIDEKITIRVNETRLDGPVARVLSNSFAFGGNNISVVIGAPR